MVVRDMAELLSTRQCIYNELASMTPFYYYNNSPNIMLPMYVAQPCVLLGEV